MTTMYESWDVASRNLIRTYDSEDEALSAVRTFIEDDGEESIKGLPWCGMSPMVAVT